MVGEPNLRLGEVLDGKYEIVRIIGTGSMGIVYAARHNKLGRDVAIKTLRRDYSDNPEAVARFEREALAAGALRHRNIAEIFDAGATDDGLRYLVLELLEGRDLKSKLDTSDVLPDEAAIHIVAQLLEGLAAAHSRGIVHRDLKPENVVVVLDDEGNNVVKILDFGISKILEKGGKLTGPRATLDGRTVGTPRYMSPEQVRGSETLDHRTDIWSAGVMLYELICEETPFEQDTVVAAMSAVLEHRFPKPSEHRDDISPELEQVILKAMAAKPEDRFHDARAMHHALISLPEVRESRHFNMPETLPPPAPGEMMADLDGLGVAPPSQVVPRIDLEPIETTSQTGLAAAGTTSNEAEVLAALMKKDLIKSDPSLPASDSVPEPAPAPPEPVLDSAPQIPDADEPIPNLTADAFAPPPEPEQILVAAQGLREGERRRRQSVASTSHTMRAIRGTGRTRTTVIAFLLVALLAAGGFAFYRYHTLGYLITPPPKTDAEIVFSVDPSDAAIEVDGDTIAAGPFVAEFGKTYKVRFSATGRIGVRVSVEVRADKPSLAVSARLHHHVPPLPRAPVAPERYSGSKDPPAIADIDGAHKKLARYRDCVTATGESLERASRAYKASTKGRIRKRSLPVVESVSAALVGSCRAATELAASKAPKFDKLDELAAVYVKRLEAAGQLATILGNYYNKGEWERDDLKMGRARHREMRGLFEDSVTALERLRLRIQRVEAEWLWKELALVERVEGVTDHSRMRRLVLTARQYAAAVHAESPPSVRAQLLRDFRQAMVDSEAASLDPDGTTDGGQSVVNTLKPLNSEQPSDPVRAVNQAIDVFNSFDVRSASGSSGQR